LERKRKKWTQAELAKQSGVSRNWIIELEKGKPNLLPVVIGANEKASATPLADQCSVNTINLDDILDRHTNQPTQPNQPNQPPTNPTNQPKHPDIRKPSRPTKPSSP